jgi:antitoxin component YwqK of YwqJK toxin-antitoxin module
MADLHITEIPYDSGSIHFRYSRMLSDDSTRWIRHGLFVEYSGSGTVLAEGRYVKGKEDGLWCSFHENGQKAAEGHYVAGKEEGTWNFWAPTGQQEQSVNYRSGEEVAEK